MNKKIETLSGAWIFGSCCWLTSKLEIWSSEPCKWHWTVYRWRSVKDEVRNSLKFWTRRVHDSIVQERLITSSCAVVWRLKIGVMGESETWDGVWDFALCPRASRWLEYWSGVRTLPSSGWRLGPLQSRVVMMKAETMVDGGLRKHFGLSQFEFRSISMPHSVH